ncbi:Nn.00g038390.m01.CDS01 [Neocucurbitaria sp. VM-36]
METATDTTSQSRSRHRHSNHSTSPSATPTYGYHNTFHTHAQLPIGPPPSFAIATDPQTLRCLDERARTEQEVARNTTLPPSYNCTVEVGGVVGVKQELSSPFQVSGHREWYDAYAVLRGTQLNIHRIKHPGLLSKNKLPSPGRLLRTYTLQHAEVGVASDFKKTPLIPKSPFAHLVPSAARSKLYETDPHLFEPVREHAIRLRLELEQFILCLPTQEDMLSWIEALCAAIDISTPLEDRSEPRYRSLPRRSRRQRILDSAQLGDNLENLSSLEAGRRIIAQQEQIIRQLYPHLGGTREPGPIASASPAAADLELEEFDPEDVRFPTRPARDSLIRTSLSQEYENGDDERPSTGSSSDPKIAPRLRPTPSQILRYRRRCAPVLLASSPRVSDVVFCAGKRVRINVKEHTLTEYKSHPPRYDAHKFPKSKRPARIATNPVSIPSVVEKTIPPTVGPTRPGSPIRGVSDDSITSISFSEELANARLEQSSEDTGSSTPPSPTAISHTKADAARQLATMGKRRSEDSRETGLSAVALGVGLLI